MANSTPHFNDMIAARGGKGSSATGGGSKGGKMPKPAQATTPKAGGGKGSAFGKSGAGGAC